ncbi:MAG TPA: hypothetical protein PK466_11110 [Thermotogota bacterium]|nr:hypothetical protein [Thermotogota bacterium]HPJ90076.1 hypothetical protein [Thermotogota bacterium]HPR96875.1 hypothetical protein [Thermotogota bacterium]
MTYQITRTLIKIFAGAIILIVYLLQVIGRYQKGIFTLDSLQPLAQLMFIFIGVSIGILIAVEILFHILFSIGVAVKGSIKNGVYTEVEKDIEKTIKQEMVQDEMGKMIDLKSMKIGYIAVGFCSIASLAVLAIGYPVFLTVNIIFCSIFIAEITEGFARMFYYKRGI